MTDGLELRHLRYFVALAGELHFSRAAEALHVSQPLLSRQIRDIERIVGVPLVGRTRPTVELTAAGRKFFEQAQHTLQQAELALRSARAANGSAETLSIAFEPCSVFHGFRRFATRIGRALPDLRLEICELPVAEHVHRLRSGEIDLAYAHRNEEASGIGFTSLGWETLFLLVPSRHRLARRRKLALESLAGEPFIFWRRALAPACHDYVIGLLESHGVDPRPKHLATDHRKSLEMVGAGLGWTIAPECARRVGQRGVAFRSIDGVTAKVEIGVSFLREHAGRKLNVVKKVWIEAGAQFRETAEANT